MNGATSILIFFLMYGTLAAQYNSYGPSQSHPFGSVNPAAQQQLSDYSEMIGTCDCISQRRNQDGSWQDSIKMVWTFEYILNGFAIQDKSYKEDNSYSSSIRMFNSDSSKWYVHYYSSNSVTPKLNTWAGRRSGNTIVLSMPQKAPNGMDGFSRLSFYDISSDGFKWIGEWHTPDTTIVYPFWKIECLKRKE